MATNKPEAIKPHTTRRPASKSGTPLTFKEAEEIREFAARGVARTTIMAEYYISHDTLLAVINRRGRYAENAPRSPSRTQKVLAATNHCRSAVAAIVTAHQRARVHLVRQLADLDSKYYADLEKAIKVSCTITGAPYIETYNSIIGAVGSTDARRGLDAMQVQAIRKALASGVSGNKLAAHYGVSAMAISRLRTGKTYKT
jgi:hypothetical protein